MKCNHKYHISGKEQQCTLEEHINNIPIDNFGKCIFHSSDIQWKFSNNFKDYLNRLGHSINEKRLTTFGFHDFVFIGEDVNFEETHQKVNLIYYSKFLFKPALTFYDCTFWAEIEVNNSLFKNQINFINCKFEKETTLNGCIACDEINIFDNCSFKDKLSFYNQNHFKNNVNIINSTFSNDLDIDAATFDSSLFIDENEFHIENGLYIFASELKKGFSLRNNRSIGLLSIEENKFHEQSLILNLSQNTSLQFSHNDLFGEVRFQGTPESLLFNPNTVLELKLANFVTNESRIIFDYCDIFNLSENLLRKLTEWEEIEKVVLNETNKMSRFKSIHYVYTRSLDNDLLEDICTLIVRYFKHLFSNKLTIRFERYISEEKIKIVFESKSLIASEEFITNYSDCILSAFSNYGSNDNFPSTLSLQKNHILERIKLSKKSKLSKVEDVLNLLCLNEKEIYLNVADKIIIGNNVIDKATTIYLPESNNNQINIYNTSSMAQNIHSCNIGIIVPLLEELNGLLKIFGQYEIIKPSNSIRTYYKVTIPTFDNSVSFKVVLTLLNQMGNVESAICAMDMINVWNPEKLLIIGIAGGFSREHQELGEVIIADSLFYFEEQKLKSDKVDFRPDMLKSDRQLYNHARSLSNYPNLTLPKAHFGVIVSGEKVTTDNLFKERLLRLHSKLLGVEMESWGVAATAFSQFQQLGFLTIRGISDYADPDKNDDFREIAIKNAAIWAHSFIRSNPFTPIEIKNNQDSNDIHKSIKELVNIKEPNFAFELYKKMNKSMDFDDFRIFLNLMVEESEGNLKGGTDEAKMADLIARFRRREKLEELYFHVDFFLKNR